MGWRRGRGGERGGRAGAAPQWYWPGGGACIALVMRHAAAGNCLVRSPPRPAWRHGRAAAVGMGRGEGRGRRGPSCGHGLPREGRRICSLSLYYSRPPARGMEYVYAALLLHKLDKDVTEQSVSSVVQASGAEVNQAQVKSLVAALADVDIDEAVKAAPVAVAAAAAPAAAAPAAEESGDAAEEKKEKDDSQSEEQAMAGLTSLFG